MNLYVSLRRSTSQREFITFENVNPETFVRDLKTIIAQRAELDPRQIQLVYSCQPLKDDFKLKILEDEDGEDAKIIHATLLVQDSKPEPRKLSTIEQQQLVLLFRAALSNPNFRQTLQNISKPESMKSLMETVPGLSEDQVALSMLDDWELLLQLTEAKVVSVLAEKHPAILDAMNRVLASVPGITNPPTLGNTRRSQQPGWQARSLGADADNDAMEEDQGPSNQQPAQGPAQPITPAQLAAALSLAQSSIRQPGPSNTQASPRTGFANTSPQAPVRPNNASNIANASGGLTPEIFSQALLQAMSQMAQPVAQRPSRPSAGSGSIGAFPARQEEAQLREQFSRHLPQMRELGITDDSLSLRALQATNGDVEAAVNLIYAGLVDD